MENRLKIKNARIYDREAMELVLRDIIVSNGKVEALSLPSENRGGLDIDVEGKILLKPFCDYHLHMPGRRLYDLFGVNLSDCDSVEEYAERIKTGLQNKGDIIKGFGWKSNVISSFFDKKAKVTELEFIDSICHDRAIILFSDDFHSCWCNSKAIELIKKHNIQYIDDDGTGFGSMLHGHIAKEIFNVPELSFSKEEIAEAILSYQRQVLGYGITEVFSFMFIGAAQFSVLEVLSELEKQGKLKIKVYCCYDIYCGQSQEEILTDIIRCRSFKSKQIDFVFAKIYIDGIIDNHTAWLKKPYADKDTTGHGFWEQSELQAIVDFLHEQGIPVHAHAIGDKAAEVVAQCIAQSKRKLAVRDVITHLQLCGKETVKVMSENDIIACFQPFWFSDNFLEEGLDKKRLGNRVYYEYPINWMIASNVKILFSSDSPVTNNFNPLHGIKSACDKISGNQTEAFKIALDAYTINSYFGEDSQIRPNDNASFICLSEKSIKDLFGGAEIEFIMHEGKMLDQ